MNHGETLNQWVGNGVSAAAIITSILGWAPAAAAIVGLLYYLIQIYESATLQRWLANRRTRKLARLKARVIMLEAQGKPALPGPEESGKH